MYRWWRKRRRDEAEAQDASPNPDVQGALEDARSSSAPWLRAAPARRPLAYELTRVIEPRKVDDGAGGDRPDLDGGLRDNPPEQVG